MVAVVGATSASSAPTAQVAPPGITIQPDLPEPGEAQFAPGQGNVVPPTAPPATDIGGRPIQSLAPASTRARGSAGSTTTNPLANLYRDTFAWGPYAPYKVGNGNGNINWRLNPYKNPSWYMWFHSLRWLGQGIIAAGKGDRPALARVNTIAHDWVTRQPVLVEGRTSAPTSRRCTGPTC